MPKNGTQANAPCDAQSCPPEAMTYKLAYTIDEVCNLTGLGRTTAYNAIGGGVLVAKKCGRKTLVLHHDLINFLRALPNIEACEGAILKVGSDGV
jgi:excisionase family DNA binding protein